MAKGDKYLGLKHYLKNSGKHEVTLSFDEIEVIIKEKLPESASTHPYQWWANHLGHSEAIAWMDAGYETVNVSETFKTKTIVFRRQKVERDVMA